MATQISSISDTALLTALYRAQESERRDAIFHDPYARVLAGERAEQLAHMMHAGPTTGYPIVVRTYTLDEFITHLIEEQHADTVLNLAAGLDTRPYRLHLPSTLRWIEVDLPSLLRYKEEKLAAFTPNSPIERVALDLANEEQRQSLFARVNMESRSTLIVTEGLLNYLSEQQVRALSRDLSRYEHMRWWCTDLASPLLLRILRLVWGASLRKGEARFQFTPADAESFFQGCSWQIERRSDARIAYRLRREVGLEKAFRWISYLPGRTLKRTFRFGDTLVLKRISA